MEDKDFIPYSSPIPIAGTSYSAQIGKSSAGNWKMRLIKGRKVMGAEEFDELNGNLMIAFIMRETAIPMLNPYKISQSVKMLIGQAERGPLQAKLPPSPPPQAAASASRTSEYDVPKRTSTATVPEVTSISAPTAMGGDKGCPRCNSATQPNWLLCAFCGQQLKQYNCPGCSKEIRYDFSLCPFCGIKIK